MIKFINFVTDDGEHWKLPKYFVADIRAKYYAGIDKETTYEQELKWAMDDDDVCNEWLENNMNWADYGPHLKQVEKPGEITFEEKFYKGIEAGTAKTYESQDEK